MGGLCCFNQQFMWVLCCWLLCVSRQGGIVDHKWRPVSGHTPMGRFNLKIEFNGQRFGISVRCARTEAQISVELFGSALHSYSSACLVCSRHWATYKKAWTSYKKVELRMSTPDLAHQTCFLKRKVGSFTMLIHSFSIFISFSVVHQIYDLVGVCWVTSFQNFIRF